MLARMTRSTVAIVRARSAQILDDVERVLELAGLADAVAPGAPVMLVPCVGSPFPFPAANTTPWQLEGAIRGLRARGAGALSCAGVADDPLLRAYGVAGEAVAPTGAVLTVVLPTMKCDAVTTIAGATALAAGRAVFALMDGTTAGDGPGPRALRPVVKDVLLASTDPVALDAIAATMMGFDPERIAHLRAAAAAGLGVLRRTDIDVVGDVALAAQRWGFAIGGRVVDRLRERTAGGPLATLVARGADAYRELRWPLHDRGVFDHWREATSWGRLFERYAALGALAAPGDRAS